MSNSNINLQTQSSNALHNAIMEAGSKDRPPMLALVPVAEGSSETTTERYMKNYKNVLQHIRDQLNAEAEAVQIILTRIDNDIYSTVDACPNACEMWKAIKRLKQGIFGSAEVWDHVITAWSMGKEAGVQLNAEQADWKDDTDDESDDQELIAHYIYMAQIQEVTPDPVDSSGPIFDDEPMHKVQNNNDNYNVFAIENEHPEQPESSNHIYLAEQGDTKITIDSLDICYNRDQDDKDLLLHDVIKNRYLKKFQAELDKYNDVNYVSKVEIDCAKAKERDLLASLIQKLKCKIDDSKNRNIFLESSNKALVDKLKGEIEDFKTKNKSLESSNNHFKEANNEPSKTNQLMFKDLKKFQAELDKYNDVNYASKVKINCAKAKGDLMSYKIDFEKSLIAWKSTHVIIKYNMKENSPTTLEDNGV
ncbi:hypothetical protein Tco_0352703 [Tanacetum coccineum]